MGGAALLLLERVEGKKEELRLGSCVVGGRQHVEGGEKAFGQRWRREAPVVVVGGGGDDCCGVTNARPNVELVLLRSASARLERQKSGVGEASVCAQSCAAQGSRRARHAARAAAAAAAASAADDSQEQRRAAKLRFGEQRTCSKSSSSSADANKQATQLHQQRQQQQQRRQKQEQKNKDEQCAPMGKEMRAKTKQIAAQATARNSSTPNINNNNNNCYHCYHHCAQEEAQQIGSAPHGTHHALFIALPKTQQTLPLQEQTQFQATTQTNQNNNTKRTAKSNAEWPQLEATNEACSITCNQNNKRASLNQAGVAAAATAAFTRSHTFEMQPNETNAKPTRRQQRKANYLAQRQLAKHQAEAAGGGYLSARQVGGSSGSSSGSSSSSGDSSYQSIINANLLQATPESRLGAHPKRQQQQQQTPQLKGNLNSGAGCKVGINAKKQPYHTNSRPQNGSRAKNNQNITINTNNGNKQRTRDYRSLSSSSSLASSVSSSPSSSMIQIYHQRNNLRQRNHLIQQQGKTSGSHQILTQPITCRKVQPSLSNFSSSSSSSASSTYDSSSPAQLSPRPQDEDATRVQEMVSKLFCQTAGSMLFNHNYPQHHQQKQGRFLNINNNNLFLAYPHQQQMHSNHHLNTAHLPPFPLQDQHNQIPAPPPRPWLSQEQQQELRQQKQNSKSTKAGDDYQSDENHITGRTNSVRTATATTTTEIPADKQLRQPIVRANNPSVGSLTNLAKPSQASKKQEAHEFTVISYNVLCDRMVNNEMFPSSPDIALNWFYRRELILRQLLEFDADVIALQELELEQYETYFKIELHQLGLYESVFEPKSRARTMDFYKRRRVDGCAIFYKMNKFKLIQSHLLEFNQIALANAQGSEAMINRVMTKDNIGLAAVLEFNEPQAKEDVAHRNEAQRILVCNTHIHWDPEFCDVKLIQTIMLMNELKCIAKHYAGTARGQPSEGCKTRKSSISDTAIAVQVGRKRKQSERTVSLCEPSDKSNDGIVTDDSSSIDLELDLISKSNDSLFTSSDDDADDDIDRLVADHKDLKLEEIEDDEDESALLPLVLLGDFNSLPNSGVTTYLTRGKINSSHKDFKNFKYTNCSNALALNNLVNMNAGNAANCNSKHGSNGISHQQSSITISPNNNNTPLTNSLRRQSSPAWCSYSSSSASSSPVSSTLDTPSYSSSPSNLTTSSNLLSASVAASTTPDPPVGSNQKQEPLEEEQPSERIVNYNHPFQLVSAYEKDTMPYTNYTHKFKAIIDYIFYTRSSLQLIGLLGPLDKKWLKGNRIKGLPQPHLPSDHLPLLVKLRLTPDQPMNLSQKLNCWDKTKETLLATSPPSPQLQSSSVTKSNSLEVTGDKNNNCALSSKQVALEQQQTALGSRVKLLDTKIKHGRIWS